MVTSVENQYHTNIKRHATTIDTICLVRLGLLVQLVVGKTGVLV